MINARSFLTKPKSGIQVNRSHPLARGLVSYWRMSEGAGTKIYDAVSNNIGTLTNFGLSGNTSNWCGSHFGGTLSFDGTNDYIPTLKTPISTYPVSFSCWCQLSAPVASGAAILVSVVNTANLNEFWLDLFQGNLLRTVAQEGANAYVSSATIVQDNKWHHCVGVFTNATTQAVYLDGRRLVVSPSTTGSGSPNPSGLNMISIGGFIYNTSVFYSPSIERKIDEVRIYNRSLSQLDVMQLYTQPHADLLFPKILF